MVINSNKYCTWEKLCRDYAEANSQQTRTENLMIHFFLPTSVITRKESGWLKPIRGGFIIYSSSRNYWPGKSWTKKCACSRPAEGVYELSNELWCCRFAEQAPSSCVQCKYQHGIKWHNWLLSSLYYLSLLKKWGYLRTNWYLNYIKNQNIVFCPIWAKKHVA